MVIGREYNKVAMCGNYTYVPKNAISEYVSDGKRKVRAYICLNNNGNVYNVWAVDDCGKKIMVTDSLSLKEHIDTAHAELEYYTRSVCVHNSRITADIQAKCF